MTEITETPGVQGGEPCVAGTRTPVRSIVMLSRVYDGDLGQVQRGLPHLSRAQIDAALLYYLDHQAEIDEIIRLNEEAGAALLAATSSLAAAEES